MGAHQHATWIEISRSALRNNLTGLARLAGPGTRLAPVVKANAYGHGLVLVAHLAAEWGAEIVCVNDVAEGQCLRDAGIRTRIYVVGPTFPSDAVAIVASDLDVVVFSDAQVDALDTAAAAAGRRARVHVKVETGTHRQGLPPDRARALIDHIGGCGSVALAGVTTHLADVEDETEHTFARVQLERFERAVAYVPTDVWRHCASSAAHILFPTARWDMVRPGIATYGIWPSRETRISADILHGGALELMPVLSWRTRIAQLTTVRKGDYVGYGRAHRVSGDRTIALLPVGYYDGYDRTCSGQGQVLVRGRRASVVGRVCMNMAMVDVTEISGVAVGESVTLIGADGDETITADEMAGWASTISYEVVARLHSRIPRVVVA